MQELTRDEIIISEEARAHFLRQLSTVPEAEAVKGVTFAIKDGKGCGGSEYMIDVVKDIDGMDFIKMSDDYSFYIKPMDLFRLLGTKIHFGKGELGFEQVLINNPNESGQCGCGMSVTFDELKA
jgi:iron-sulfur cluster assembly protein